MSRNKREGRYIGFGHIKIAGEGTFTGKLLWRKTKHHRRSHHWQLYPMRPGGLA